MDEDDAPPLTGFNSRTREGCDFQHSKYHHHIESFNSRTREGCDWLYIRTTKRPRRFNSRTREGCDAVTGS